MLDTSNHKDILANQQLDSLKGLVYCCCASAAIRLAMDWALLLLLGSVCVANTVTETELTAAGFSVMQTIMRTSSSQCEYSTSLMSAICMQKHGSSTRISCQK
jgi:hypothetical protein